MRLTCPDGPWVAERLGKSLVIKGHQSYYQIFIISSKIFRIRHVPYGSTCSSIDESLMCDFKVTECGDYLQIETDDIILKINTEKTLSLTWSSSSGEFAKDLPHRSYEIDIGTGCNHYMQLSDETNFYGLGERASPLVLNDRNFSLSCVDAMGYNAKMSDPLYKHIPFYIALNTHTRESYSILYNTFTNGSFDFGREIDALWGRYVVYRGKDNYLDYTMIYGPSIASCTRQFASVVGLPIIPPKYALGYLASSMGYAEDEMAQNLLEDFPNLCRKWDIPCDVMHLSSGYTVDSATSARNVFTWNSSRFPDPKRLFRILKKNGIKVVANVKPWLLTGHPMYEKLCKDKGFVWDPKNDCPGLSRLWSSGPGCSDLGSFIDFTSTAGISFWKHGIKELLNFGIEGIWNDNNEFSIPNDDFVLANAQNVGTFGRANLTLEMAKQSYMALQEFRKAHQMVEQPFLITRSSSVGSHSFACQSWSGDNYTSWETLQHNIPMGLNAGLCLLPGYGHDVGGFAGPVPEPELFVRWVQNGIFHPRFTIHSWKHKEGVITEPWMFPEMVHHIRFAIKLRYRLIPYLYCLSLESGLTGNPVIRPLVYEFQSDPKTDTRSFEFMLGSKLLIASVVEPGKMERSLYLPGSFSKWCDFFSGTWYDGGQDICVSVPISQPGAVFAIEGAIIPMHLDDKPFIDSKEPDLSRKLLLFCTASQNEFVSTITDRNEQTGEIFEYNVKIFSSVDKITVIIDNFESLPFKEIHFQLSNNDPRPIPAPFIKS